MAKENTSQPTEDKPSKPSAQKLRDTRHYFPEHSLTITADTREEAEKELAAILKQEKEDN